VGKKEIGISSCLLIEMMDMRLKAENEKGDERPNQEIIRIHRNCWNYLI
jgi:hypothetical protein